MSLSKIKIKLKQTKKLTKDESKQTELNEK